MKIVLNGELTEITEETTEELREGWFPDCNVVIVDGVPVTVDTGIEEYSRIYIGKCPKGLTAAITQRNNLPSLKSATVGIAGAGGLGSNVATYLARAGVGWITIADYDRVEFSNLNRQNFNLSHLGLFKVDAVSDVISQINPEVVVEGHTEKLDPASVRRMFAGCDVVVEAFDAPEEKAMLLETVTAMGIPLVCGSGMAGIGDGAMEVRELNGVTVVGDGESDASEGILAPRVAACAGVMANKVLQILVSRKTRNE